MTFTKLRPVTAVVVAAGLAIFVQAQSASAIETIKLVAIDGYPARSMWVREFSNFFIPQVDAELAKIGNYQIKWQEA